MKPITHVIITRVHMQHDISIHPCMHSNKCNWDVWINCEENQNTPFEPSIFEFRCALFIICPLKLQFGIVNQVGYLQSSNLRLFKNNRPLTVQNRCSLLNVDKFRCSYLVRKSAFFRIWPIAEKTRNIFFFGTWESGKVFLFFENHNTVHLYVIDDDLLLVSIQ